jgi:hypothetical protein
VLSVGDGIARLSGRPARASGGGAENGTLGIVFNLGGQCRRIIMGDYADSGGPARPVDWPHCMESCGDAMIGRADQRSWPAD